MKKYFVKITADHWTPKNKAEEAIQKNAYEFERKVIHGSELEKFKREFSEMVENVNSENKRCKPLKLDVLDSYLTNDNDIHIQVRGITHLTLYEIKSISGRIFYNPSMDEALNSGDGIYRP